MSEDISRLAELDFSSLEDWEIEHCWWYEFTRLVPDLVGLIKAWRAQVPRKKGQNRFDAYLSHQGGRLTQCLRIEDRVFVIPPGAYYLFPEWPDHYLRIPGKIRYQRLKKLWQHEKDWLEPREKEEPTDGRDQKPKQTHARASKKRVTTSIDLRMIDPSPAEYGLDPVIGEGLLLQTSVTKWNGGAFNRVVESLQESIRRSNKLRVFPSKFEELALLRINWALSDKSLTALFLKWLAANRPIAFQQFGTLGRSHPLPTRRTDLEILRKYLLVKDTNNWNWRLKVSHTRLFRDRSKWTACSKALEKIVADLGSYTGCTS